MIGNPADRRTPVVRGEKRLGQLPYTMPTGRTDLDGCHLPGDINCAREAVMNDGNINCYRRSTLSKRQPAGLAHERSSRYDATSAAQSVRRQHHWRTLAYVGVHWRTLAYTGVPSITVGSVQQIYISFPPSVRYSPHHFTLGNDRNSGCASMD